jgi:hypothetical protein
MEMRAGISEGKKEEWREGEKRDKKTDTSGSGQYRCV